MKITYYISEFYIIKMCDFRKQLITKNILFQFLFLILFLKQTATEYPLKIIFSYS
jgi:REP element-mobilizing transposase RayT